MDNITFTVLLIAGILGFSFGTFIVYSIVFRKEWAERANRDKGLFFPSFKNPVLNRANSIWGGIVLMIFFGGFIFALIQEHFIK
jgi:hypothetical protein